MKFRTIFFLFNVVLLFSFAFIFLMPFFLLGMDYSLSFWGSNWPLGVFFLLVLGGFNAFFIYNWKLFILVEKEDWDSLSSWLQGRIFKQGRMDRRYVRLLVNASLLRSDMATIERLEALLADKHPRLLARDAVVFGAARLLKNEPQATEAYLSRFIDNDRVENNAWLSFYYAFTLLLLKRPADAHARLKDLIASRDAVLAIVSSYAAAILCAPALPATDKASLVEAAEARREHIVKRFGTERWAREIERAKAEVHIVILSKLIDEACQWMTAKAKKDSNA